MVVRAINAHVNGPTCFNKKNQNLKFLDSNFSLEFLFIKIPTKHLNYFKKCSIYIEIYDNCIEYPNTT